MIGPAAVRLIETEKPFIDLEIDEPHLAVHAVFLWRGTPVGEATLPIVDGVCRASDQRDALFSSDAGWVLLENAVAAGMASSRGRIPVEQLGGTGEPQLDLPGVTVAICTRDRAEDLERALGSLAGQDMACDIVVIDNAPTSEAVENVAASHGVRHVVEPRRGLDFARNRAISEAHGEVLAFLDDDAVASPGWVRAIATAFALEPHLAGLTGPVLPLELGHEAQLDFENWGGFNRGYRRRWLQPQLDTGSFGTGANMAFRTWVFERVGGFDPALDVGTPTGGGGDLEFFWRVTMHRLQMIYEPNAFVMHRHRRSAEALARQLEGYEHAVGAYAWLAAGQPGAVGWLRQSAPLLRSQARKAARAVLRPGGRSWRDEADAMVHMLRGPRAYKAARAHVRDECDRLGPQGLVAEPVRPTRGDEHEPPVSIGVDIDSPLPDDTGAGAEYLYVRVSCGTDPLGVAWIVNDGQPVSRWRLANELAAALGSRLVEVDDAPVGRSPWGQWTTSRPGAGDERTRDELLATLVGEAPRQTVRGPAPTASIVIATLDRPDDLEQCLADVGRQSYPGSYDVIVVDNNPSSGLTPPVVARFPGVRLVREERRGLAYARNAGFLAARSEIVVATDDDVRMGVNWLSELCAPFARRDVMAVTGNVWPHEQDADPQIYFERYGGLGRGELSWIATWDGFFDTAWPVQTWSLGATANAAFRRSILADPQIGPMDEALGPGTPTGVGEDIYLFYRILKAGYSIAYQAEATVWHRHRRTIEDLRHQLIGYSRGQVAYQLTTLTRDKDLRAMVQLADYIPRYVTRELTRSLTRRPGALPLSLRVDEVRGFLGGGPRLVRSRRRVRELGHYRPGDFASEWSTDDD